MSEQVKDMLHKDLVFFYGSQMAETVARVWDRDLDGALRASDMRDAARDEIMARLAALEADRQRLREAARYSAIQLARHVNGKSADLTASKLALESALAGSAEDGQD